MIKNFKFIKELFFIKKKFEYEKICKWDYLGHYEHNNHDNGNHLLYPQIEWNNTLITKINQVSAQIHKSTLRGGGNNIYINPCLLPLFETLPYYYNQPYGDSEHMLSGRYKINIDNSLPTDEVLVKHVEQLETAQNITGDDFLLVSEITRPEEGDRMAEVTMRLMKKSDMTDDEINKEINKRCGIIKILSYE